jgi:hypothetical protein
MTLVLQIAVVVCLAVIALQLHRIGRLKELEVERQEHYRRTAELDEFLRAKFPNLFYDWKEPLTGWVQTLERNRERIGRDPEFWEDSDWEDVLFRAAKAAVEHQKEHPDDKKPLPDFSRMRKASERFVKDASSNTNLTEMEIEFLLFALWTDHKDSISSTLEPALFEYILKEQQETLQQYLSTYGKTQRVAERH